MAGPGWVVYENALDPDFVTQINAELPAAYQVRREIQQRNGIGANMQGTLHHLLERENFALPLLSKMLCHEEITFHLKGKYILNGINGVMHTRDAGSYIGKMHRDVRTFTREAIMMIQMIITLDEFTTANGATYFLSGSHLSAGKPDEEYFYRSADRAVAPAGSVILFDSNLWHAAGENLTDMPRRALTLGYTRPFIKPQFDFPRFLGYGFAEQLEPSLRQVIGYNARIPENLQEYYQPVALRCYQPDQG